MICNVVLKLDKQESTTPVQGSHVPEAQFTKLPKQLGCKGSSFLFQNEYFKSAADLVARLVVPSQMQKT